MFKDRIEYDHLKTLEEAIRKRTSVIFRIRIKQKIYLIGKQKDVITLIKERGIPSCSKILEITTKGIKEIIIKVLNHKTLQQKKENLPLPLIKTLHRGNH